MREWTFTDTGMAAVAAQAHNVLAGYEQLPADQLADHADRFQAADGVWPAGSVQVDLLQTLYGTKGRP